MEKVGYGIIGAGWVLPSHAIGVRNLCHEDVELTAVADLDEGRARQAAIEFAAKHWYTDYHNLLARDDIQVVSICLPHYLHKEVVSDAVQAGKHVLCEKPLAVTTVEADAMITAAHEAGVQLSVIFQHRYDPPFQRLHQAVQKGAFGQILMGLVFHKSTIRANPDLTSHWRDQWPTAGGGVLMMQAIHFLDILQWCLGPVQTAAAMIDTLARSEQVEDSGAAVLRFRSGALGTIVSTNASNTERLTRIEIHGTTGAAVIENDRFVVWKPASDYDEQPLSDEEPLLTTEERRRLVFGTGHVKQIADFVDRVRKGLPPFITAEEGRHATAIMEAIYESSRTGQLVSVS